MVTLDDNRVDARNSFSFYEELIKVGKSELVQMCVTKKGNPEPKGHAHGLGLKGHFLPTRNAAFIRYAETIRIFLDRGVSVIPSLTRWQAFRGKIIAEQFAKKGYSASPPGTALKKFLAASLDLYSKEHHTLEESEFDLFWEIKYKSLYYTLEYVEELVTNKSKLKSETDRLLNQDLLTDEVVSNALKSQWGIFSQFVHEWYEFDILTLTDSNQFAQNKKVIETFKELFLSLTQRNNPFNQKRFYDKNMAHTLFYSLYSTNPSLLANIIPLIESPDLSSFVKIKLHQTLLTQSEMIKNIWQESSRAFSTMKFG